tara:strand:- start:1161 stop:1418 length:258 start_codon:yes stop_codon:yes gene_type:complete
MMNDNLQDMIQVSCEEAITPDVEAQLEQPELAEALGAAYGEPSYKETHGRCEDAPCCGCCGNHEEDGYGSPADDAWHEAQEYPEW